MGVPIAFLLAGQTRQTLEPTGVGGRRKEE